VEVLGDLLGQVIEDLGQPNPRGIGLMRAFTFADPVAKVASCN